MSYSLQIKLLFALLVCHTVSSVAQDIKYRVKHISVTEGLSHSDATSIVQDKTGFIWIGTFSGLNRYDGQHIKQYRNQNTKLQSVYHNRINSIAIDSSNQLWLGTDDGIVLFDVAKEVFTEMEMKLLPESNVNKIFVRLTWVSDSLIVALSNNLQRVTAFKRISKTQLQEIPFADYFPSCTYFSITPSGINQLLISSNNGVFAVSYDEKKDRPVSVKKYYLQDQHGQLHQNVSGIFQEAGRKFIAAVNNGFCSFNLSTAGKTGSIINSYFTNISTALPAAKYNGRKNLDILFIAPDVVPGSYWMATPDGVLKYQYSKSTPGGKKTVQFIKQGKDIHYNLSSDFLNTLFIDRSGCLWVLTYGGGVNLINLYQKKFYLLSDEASNLTAALSGNHIRALLEDENDGLWVGTRFQGLNRYDFINGSNTIFRHQQENSNSLMSDNVRALAKDKKGRIWIGNDFGIDIYDGKQFRHIYEQQLTGNAIYSIAVDVFGQLWAGSWHSGLNKITENNEGQFSIQKLFHGQEGISGKQVSFVYADQERPEIFVGTSGGLDRILLKADGSISEILHYRGKESDPTTLSSNFIWPVVRTNANTLWVGTLGGGLNKITLEGTAYHAKAYGLSNGLPFVDVETLLEDNDGNLWMGGGNGLVMFNTKTEVFTQYDVYDGLQSNSFKIGAACKGKDGRLYFGGIHGVNYFYPQEINKSNRYYPLVFTDLLLNDKAVQPGKESVMQEDLNTMPRIHLNHRQNYFSIRFAALDFATSGKWYYRYKLSGFDPDWVEADASHAFASYSHLSPGHYHFSVQASVDKKTWNISSSMLPVTIAPPWWKTTSAKLLYTLIALSLAYIVWKYTSRMIRLKRALHIKELEEKQHEEHHRMRLDFFTNISHELRTPLGLILAPAEKLIEDANEADKQKGLYLLIQKNAQRLLRLVNELMDFRKAEEGSVKLKASETEIISFISSLTNDFREVAAQKDIKLHFTESPASFHAWTDPVILEKIIVNILANAIKYTPAHGNIYIKLLTDELPSSSFSNSFKVSGSVAEKDLYWIKVTDTGSGIDAHSLNRIFERYFQGEEYEHNHQVVSTGIGLALVKSLTLAHRGSVYVCSQRLMGSEFFIGLPKGYHYLHPDEISLVSDYELSDQSITGLEKKYKPGHSFVHNQEIDGKQPLLPKLLVVEDNADLRNFLFEHLSQIYKVFTASNAQTGFDIALKELPDIIVSDVMMPGMDGIEFCRKIKSTIEISHIPVVLLTAKNSVDSRVSGAESGAELYMSKPFSLRLLKTNLHNLLASRKKLKELYLHNGLSEARELAGNAKDKEFLDTLVSFIHEQMDKPELDVETICRGMAISKSKLYIKMHQVTGHTIGDFVRKIKLKYAAQLLVAQHRTVSEVLFETGFQSASHFTKAFKKEFGKTPTQYVKDFSKHSS
ncbi:hybrid sensor histidine kinase/response regulator transcription factor [Lacibacter sp.]|uniref:hybrid sensor histidine kinase/response regulator transcription factor n=1 Tax=Lacibacter sp. TaxID=1915409 RepID=UPI002B4B118E|nr:two-component regulator propeller domain-containing protein [Lacibacter sp.]HLP37610.1 two-component regulator propeller domain-containing protein [Lacibacter sp.]